MKKTVICLLVLFASAATSAATYNMTTSRPPCSSNDWDVAGSTYTCDSGTITLASGDVIVSGTGNPITVVGEGGVTLAGSNTIGSTSANVAIRTTYGALTASGSGTVVYGNVTATSGAISLTSATVNGNVTTNGTVTLSGGTVTGNVSGGNGVTTSNGSIINGNVVSASGSISLSGGSVGGAISSNCCTVTTTNTNVANGISSSNNTVNINGGTVAGPISSSGGSGVVITNATVSSGSITAGSVGISISNSTIGSPSSPVNVTGNNTVVISNGSAVYGDVTAGDWSSAMNIDSSSTVYGVCQSNSNSISTPSQYPRCASAVPLAEWRMDESSWNGTSGEVRDSIGSYHGVAARAAGNGSRPTTAAGSPAYTSSSTGLTTCRYGEFDRTSSPARTYTYVQLGSFPSLPGPFTFAGWIRTTDRTASGQRILVRDDDNNDGGWGLSLGDGGTGALRLFNRTASNTGNVSGDGQNGNCGVFCIDTDNVVTNNAWFFVAATINTATKDVTLYVFNQNGVRQARVTGKYSGTWGSGSGLTAIGGETASSSEGTQSGFHFRGNIDELKVYGSALTETALRGELTRSRSCTALVNHIRIEHDGEGLTCSPELVTVKACADANCSSLYTGSVTLNLAPGGAGVTFTGSTTTATVSRTTVGQATLSATDVSPGVIGATRCFNGNTETCLMNFVDSGFVFNIPDHIAEVSQPVTLKAVKKANNSTVCTPAFVSQNKTINFKCTYSNPTSGSLPVRIAGIALNAGNSPTTACDAGGRSISLAFNAAGEASMSVLYADVGQISVDVNYTGVGAEAGLLMTGTDTFIAAPHDFLLALNTPSPIKAGSSFSARATARNALGATTRNFGKETTLETVELKSITTAAVSATNSQLLVPANGASGTITNGTTGIFARTTCSPVTDGAVCANALAWTEVGDVTLSAARASGGYLGSTFMPFGTTTTRFIPSFFETEFDGVTPTTQACGTFTYSGQPFRVRVTAKSEANAALGSSIATTLNYTGNYAKAVALGADGSVSCLPDPIGFTNAAPAAMVFASGVGLSAPVANTADPLPIIYTKVLGQPTSVTVCAKDADGVTAHGTLQAKAVLAVRNGRLRLFNAFGAGRLPLEMQAQTQYWSGKTWIQNSADSCTTVAAESFFLSNNLTSVTAPMAINGGTGVVRLAAPAAGVAGSVDIAVNLGTSGNDRSCLGGHGGVPGNRPWLRSRNCPGGPDDRDPSARASFGIYSPESMRVIHMREFF